MKKSQVILVENIYWKNVHSRPTLTKKCTSMGKNYQGKQILNFLVKVIATGKYIDEQKWP